MLTIGAGAFPLTSILDNSLGVFLCVGAQTKVSVLDLMVCFHCVRPVEPFHLSDPLESDLCLPLSTA